jgi:hypothetical protein
MEVRAKVVGSERLESARLEREAAARAWVVGMVGAVVGEACDAAAAFSPRGVLGVHVPADALVVKGGRHATLPFVDCAACGVLFARTGANPATREDVARIIAVGPIARR